MKLALSSISLAELAYLVEKVRVRPAAYEDLIPVLNDPAGVFQESPVDKRITSAMRQIAREDVPDMPDRIIAATGLYLGVPVISRDSKIRAANLESVW